MAVATARANVLGEERLGEELLLAGYAMTRRYLLDRTRKGELMRLCARIGYNPPTA